MGETKAKKAKPLDPSAVERVAMAMANDQYFDGWRDRGERKRWRELARVAIRAYLGE